MNYSSMAVFCGSKNGNNSLFIQHAKELGKLMAYNNQTLVYGGGNVGIMGAIANTMMKNGGTVIGVIPELLKDREPRHEGITELIIVNDMHSRKKKNVRAMRCCSNTTRGVLAHWMNYLKCLPGTNSIFMIKKLSS
ncbi:MAG: LOG family protein [Sphingobacteriales bacterium]